jgi:hypothetical protein
MESRYAIYYTPPRDSPLGRFGIAWLGWDHYLGLGGGRARLKGRPAAERRRAGFTSAHDRLPEWMTQEPLPPHNSVFDVPEQDVDGVFN